MFKKNGFTLAEVLITLGIIGVVAALTIPILMQKQQDMATVASLKKTFSTLANAYNLAVKDNGSPDTWQLNLGVDQIFTIMGPYLNITKNCRTSTGCFPSPYYYMANQGDIRDGGSVDGWNTWTKVQLSDGTLVAAAIEDENCQSNFGTTQGLSNTCISVLVDTNGYKPPNTQGKDFFRFLITKTAVVPAGAPEVTGGYSFDMDCRYPSSGNFMGGDGCTAWAIYNGNLDYLHCSGLSWDGPTKCS